MRFLDLREQQELNYSIYSVVHCVQVILLKKLKLNEMKEAITVCFVARHFNINFLYKIIKFIIFCLHSKDSWFFVVVFGNLSFF